MTEFIFYCAHCGAKLSADDSEIGEEFDCPTCGTTQKVPDSSTTATRSDEQPVSTTEQRPSPAEITQPRDRAPAKPASRKLVIKTSQLEEELAERETAEKLEEEVEEEVAGSGLRMLGMAIGTASVILFVLAIVWMVYAASSANREWWILMLTFLSVFVLSLMGVVVAVLAFRVERITALVEIAHLEMEE
ncbi:MAG TPA: hypothetical protein EYP62_01280 [Kiritimatiellae bacterium]|nr:hypothetical protein [Kiritimatiellia bacterium]